MNELLQKHGCSAVFSVPEGLKELMSDITREVLRDQPERIFDYITNYLSVLILTREHGVLAVKLLEDLCDCRPTVSEHLMQIGLERDAATILSDVIKEEIEAFEPIEGKEKVKEMKILKRILARVTLDEDTAERVCQISRNAYRDYWYRKKMMEQAVKFHPDETWQIAAERTLELYKKTRPSFAELNRATQKIQAAYRGYYVRKNLLRHLKVKTKKKGPKVDLPGPPVDIAASRTIDLGPVITLHVKEDNVASIFEQQTSKKLGLSYDPMKTITHVVEDDEEGEVEVKVARPGDINRRVSIKDETDEFKTDDEVKVSEGRPRASTGTHFGQQTTHMHVLTKTALRVSDSKRDSTVHSALQSIHSSPRSSANRISFAGLTDFDMDMDDTDIPEEIMAQLVEIIPEVPDEDLSVQIADARSEGDGRSTPTSAGGLTSDDDADMDIPEDIPLSRRDEASFDEA